ncbi:MAG: c-type cytochrome [Acidimicrobiia bacterium]|nr:c-type cytochrome [Acidimicrobiia bacterium]MDH3396195.1 c-type cytochrome [Acidimicrobiia bacterium]
MKKEHQFAYIRAYEAERREGLPLFPDTLIRDAVAGLAVALILAVLAWSFDAPLGEVADPTDGSFNPKPEWYFYFLFQLLRYLPGDLEVFGVVVIPGIIILGMLALPFLDWTHRRHFSSRPFVSGLTVMTLTAFVLLTINGALTIAASESAATAAQDVNVATGPPNGRAIYAAQCAACHGADGQGGPNLAVPGDIIPPINSMEYLGTRDDATLRAIIEKGQPSAGMGAYATAYGGPLSSAEIDALIDHIRSWESAPEGSPVGLP